MFFERRMYETKDVRLVRSAVGTDSLRLEGYASVFNLEARLPGFREVIRPGAFTRALREKQDCVCLFNHSENYVLGRTSSGTLRLKQDDRGLWYECDLPDTQYARDLHVSIKRQDISGCSFAFTIPDGGQSWSERGNYILREITDVDLIDVSPVTHPCYSNTEVDARNLVPAEMRGRLEAITKPKVITAAEMDHFIGGRLSFEEQIALRDRNRQRRRTEILDLL